MQIPLRADESMTKEIEVLNYHNDEIISHAMILINGYCKTSSPCETSGSIDLIEVCTTSVSTGAKSSHVWPVSQQTGDFKALVHFTSIGSHLVLFKWRTFATTLNLIYEPLESTYIIRFYYQKCYDSDGTFDAPSGQDTSEAMAMKKIQFNVLLLQAAIANMLPEKLSFAFEDEGIGIPKIHLLKSSFSQKIARTVEDCDLFQLVERDINAQDLDNGSHFKHAVILGCSHWNPNTTIAEGHTALSGGNLAIFGSCCLHTWASSIDEVIPNFLNGEIIDKNLLLDDSCGRGSYWANYSTTLGAFCHEIGHALGLGHTQTGIMSRGFDDFNQLFSIYQPKFQVNEKCFNTVNCSAISSTNCILPKASKVDEIVEIKNCTFHRASVLRLLKSPWICHYQNSINSSPPVISWSRNILGPVGSGSYDGVQARFDDGFDKELVGISLRCSNYLLSFETLDSDELYHLKHNEEIRCTENHHFFLLQKDEKITQVDIRAMAWIDSVRFHTNLRTSRFYGGTGGKLHVLKAQQGYYINAFFGSTGENYVGSMGMYCTRYRSDVEMPPQHAVNDIISSTSRSYTGLIGSGLHDGKQVEFNSSVESEVSCMCGLIIRSDTYVRSLQILFQEKYLAYIDNELPLNEYEHIFVLMENEIFLSVDIRSGCWVDALRFQTNFRISPWYGGTGGTLNSIGTAEGFFISGFYGTHGDNYLGQIGVLYKPINFYWFPKTLNSLEDEKPKQPLPDLEKSINQKGRVIGIVICIANNFGGFKNKLVCRISSFRTIEELKGAIVDKHTQNFSHKVFVLRWNEHFVQIDSKYTTVCDQKVLVGICFHTNFRSSSWYGGTLGFYDHVIIPDNCLIFTMTASYKDIQGTHYLFAVDWTYSFFDILYVQNESKDQLELLDINRILVIDTGCSTICINSTKGIKFIALADSRSGDNKIVHIWEWTGDKLPNLWCISKNQLLMEIPGSQDGNVIDLLGYEIQAMDDGGDFSQHECNEHHLKNIIHF